MTNKQIKNIAICAISTVIATTLVYGIRKLAKKVSAKVSELVSNAAEINADPNEQNSEVLAEASAENVCGCHCETPSDAMRPRDAVETCGDSAEGCSA